MLLNLEKHQSQLQAKGLLPEETKTRDLIGSRWLIKEELEEMLVEKLSDQDLMISIRSHYRLSRKGMQHMVTFMQFAAYLVCHICKYMQFIHLLEKLLTLQYGAAEEEFVQRFRRSVIIQSKKQLIEPVQYDEQGKAFSKSEGNDIL
ncbi:37S ribosomal protein S9, mitochondrial [Saguinus oedipus]|uniref:37S ribosomal protein S9, mitochondrial n=1 Tax=Saguinus oedipus TaxID=9490 RepID=A0ABQ9U7G2_SAGOE|nr:37S ribosomal protein S9, mitochondrial [Saguinus oedipus]